MGHEAHHVGRPPLRRRLLRVDATRRVARRGVRARGRRATRGAARARSHGVRHRVPDCDLDRHGGVASRGGTLVLFGGAVFAVGAPASEWISVYSSVAVLFVLVALRMLLVWLDRRDRVDAGSARARAWALVGAGAACGLSFASKPNIGLLAVAATMASIWVTPDAAPRRRIPSRSGASSVPSPARSPPCWC